MRTKSEDKKIRTKSRTKSRTKVRTRSCIYSLVVLVKLGCRYRFREFKVVGRAPRNRDTRVSGERLGVMLRVMVRVKIMVRVGARVRG